MGPWVGASLGVEVDSVIEASMVYQIGALPQIGDILNGTKSNGKKNEILLSSKQAG